MRVRTFDRLLLPGVLLGDGQRQHRQAVKGDNKKKTEAQRIETERKGGFLVEGHKREKEGALRVVSGWLIRDMYSDTAVCAYETDRRPIPYQITRD